LGVAVGRPTPAVNHTTVADIVAALGGELRGNPQTPVTGIASLEAATPTDISFLANPKYRSQLAATAAGAVILTEAMCVAAPAQASLIVVPDPYHHYARLSQWWKRRMAEDPAEAAVHPSAWVHPDAVIHPTAKIGPFCVVERGVQIGANTVLHARVTVEQGCRVGVRCILHPGVVIGADGFGFAPHAGRWEKIEQLGAVAIGDDVEIGANTCIDRGALADTVIEDGVKLDNLIQIGHNVRVGKHTAMAGCVGVAGSAVIGAHCTVGGGAVILGHLTINDHVHVSAASVVTRSIHKAGHYTGMFPIDDNASWERNAAALKQLSDLRTRIRELEKLIRPAQAPLQP
jgi:UDP-3-O-[3-hydroxymyristoyl] glucosamine N-acyltransferase